MSKAPQIHEDYIDALFTEAIHRLAAEAKDPLMDAPDLDVEPSPELDRRIKKLIRRHYWQYKSKRLALGVYRGLSKVAVWVLLFLLLSFFAVRNVSAVQQWFSRLIVEANPVSMDVRMDQKSLPPESEPISEQLLPPPFCTPRYIPSEMSLAHYEYSANMERFEFVGKNENFINISVLTTGAGISMDNENLDEKLEVNIHGFTGILTHKSGLTHIIWPWENRIIILNTSLGKTEALCIAEGLERHK